ncbi:1,2-phenylacetyl-CoA epoxidase subunit PaaC [Paracraurococcus ruber]|uniref:Phenylacetate-CoA oxygenase subunit PaaI n=1 Tax=Paracraurococcus ruber TaxID=77675 RepID=A0ABS1CXI9_9PROT|nr:1,2-phenylacetyl-CoA epoxidase subunit PaaC [Paracraurococcus ruber]MBK1659187.1 phenylacetate-CoA oxygenase subunit PaaI [Paracraurococcus ruber]TDG32830.1 phenylacetate-CoA oxygenase subunit PaaI [Paracraurococcus ruber]
MTSILVAQDAPPLLLHVLRLADTALVLGHRLSEWTGRAPMLEEELALANAALDYIGQARSLYDYAARLDGRGRTEDDLAYLRDTPDWRCWLIAELPNGDFAHSVLRQFLVAAALQPYWRALAASRDATLAAIAAKAEKEAAYHLRHAGEWVIRLGDGTDESHRRMTEALEDLWPYTGEMFEADAVEAALVAEGVAPDPLALRPAWEAMVARVLAEATLDLPAPCAWMQSGGRRGVHTEHLGHLLAVMQHLPRSYPGAVW